MAILLNSKPSNTRGNNGRKRNNLQVQNLMMMIARKDVETCKPGKNLWVSREKYSLLRENILILELPSLKEDGSKIKIKNPLFLI